MRGGRGAPTAHAQGAEFQYKFKTIKTGTALTAMNTRDWYMLYYTMHTVQGILNKVLHDALLQLLYILHVKLSIANIKINQQ